MKKIIVNISHRVILVLLFLLPTTMADASGEMISTYTNMPRNYLQTTFENFLYLPVVMVQPPPPPPLPMADEIGPFGGTFPALAVVSSTPSLVYAGTWGSGVYKSLNGGTSWSPTNSGLGNLFIQSLVVHPSDGQIIYAGTYGGGVYRSSDGGASWKESNGNVLGDKIVYDLEIAPSQPSTLYAATRITDTLLGILYKSIDDGVTWQEIFRGDRFATLDYFYDLDVNPSDSAILYLSTHEHGFYKSVNGGISWSAINSGMGDFSSRTMVLNPTNPATLYGGTWHGGGVYKSVNSGSGWNQKNSGMPDSVKIYRLTLDSSSPETIYSCTYKNGIVKTTTGADFWALTGQNNGFIYDLVIAQTSPKRLFASPAGRGLIRSDNGGDSWLESHTGIISTNIVGLATLPSQNGSIFAGINGAGVYKTSNRGASWTAVNSGLGDLWVNYLFSIKDNLYALTSTGTYKTIDGVNWTAFSGPSSTLQNWADIHEVLGERGSLPVEILADLIGPSDPNDNEVQVSEIPLISMAELGSVIYGGTAGNGVWAYSGNWSLIGLNNRRVYSLAGDTILSRLLASSCTGDANGNDTYCTVSYYRSGNWIDFNEGLGGNKVNSLMVRGDDYFAATKQGIYLRDNTGSSWVQVGLAGVNVLSLTVNPVDHRRVYAGAQWGSYFSDDSGVTWQPAASNLAGWTSQSLIVDPLDRDIIYFGSREHGIFRWDRSP